MEPKLSPEAGHAAHFGEFVLRLAQKFEPLQIFKFSQNSHTHNSQSCFTDNQGYFKCDHCLLVVTETATRVDYEMQDFANTCYRQGIITIICHDHQSIQQAVEANNRFFISVLAKGKLLYSQDGLLQVSPVESFHPSLQGVKAEKHFNHRMPLASGFLFAAAHCLEQEQYGICAFMLHQVVEQTCICLIRVHIAYRSEFHNLYRLLRLCNCFSNRPYQMLLGHPEGERLFAILAKSYSQARYKDDFTVSKLDAQDLIKSISGFLTLATEMCSIKIDALTKEATEYQNAQQENMILNIVNTTL